MNHFSGQIPLKGDEVFLVHEPTPGSPVWSVVSAVVDRVVYSTSGKPTKEPRECVPLFYLRGKCGDFKRDDIYVSFDDALFEVEARQLFGGLKN